jgi:hypothetical protein
MATGENIISPGVFTRENDLSFLPQGIGAIGAGVIGPTVKGPAFVPTIITRGFSEYTARFGGYSNDTYVPLTVKNYLRNAGTVTVCRVLGGGGWKFENSGEICAIVTGSEMVAVFHPSKFGDATTQTFLDLSGSSMSPTNPTFNQLFSVTFDGGGFSSAKTVSMSLKTGKKDYLTKALGTGPDNGKTGANTFGTNTAFPLLNFKEYHSSTLTGSAAGATLALHMIAAGNEFTSSFSEGYDHAATPWIQSGYQDANKTVQSLFKFHTIADGTDTNKNFKISIANLKEPADIDGEEQYSQFSVIVRKFGDQDKSPSIIEQFNNCTLNPNDPFYVGRVIGDRYAQWSDTQQKVVLYGDYPNKSQYCRIEMDAMVDAGGISPKLSPKGFAAVYDPIKASGFTLPSSSYNNHQTLNHLAGGTPSRKVYLGWDFDKKDNENWNLYLTKTAVPNKTGPFNLSSLNGLATETWNGSLSASVDITGASGPKPYQVQFSVPFQGGSDGMRPDTIKRSGEYLTATNMQGMNMNNGEAGYTAYKKALDIMSNQDEYDINMLALPGVVRHLHGAVTDQGVTFVEDRADCFYVMDLAGQEATVPTAVSNAATENSNYAGAYYPWVKVLDPSLNKPVFVPPSVVVLGAIAASDQIAAEWFAPAGLNRGILGNVLEARTRLNQAERDTLYDGKVNPIATFPRTGVCIWGQKTLQTRSTALDRINVRRLLIEVKKFIASSSKYLVFEQNTLQTRNRFLNIVNPYLESVQQRQGLFAFRVVMDESNNTPDVIDRNQLVGAIYLQPTRTAEFIILDFNVLPTGATFAD